MLSVLYIAQRVMWFKVVLLALSLSLLGLGAAQECEGFVGVLGMTPDQLKKEIRANVAVALKEGVINSSGNGSCVVSNQEEQNTTTLEKAVDIAIEKFNSIQWRKLLTLPWRKSLQTFQTHLNSSSLPS